MIIRRRRTLDDRVGARRHPSSRWARAPVFARSAQTRWPSDHDPAGLAPPGPKLVHVAPFPPPPPPPVSGQSWRRALVFEPYPAPRVALRQRLPRPERQRRLRRAVRAGRGACRTGGDGHCTGRRRGHPSGLGLDEGSTPTSSARRSSMSWPSTPRSASPGSTGGSTEGCRVEGSTRRRPGGGGSAPATASPLTLHGETQRWDPWRHFGSRSRRRPGPESQRRHRAAVKLSFTDGHAQRRPPPESRRHA